MRRALAIEVASLGTDHPDVARVFNNLAQLLVDTGRLAEAEPLMRRVVAILDKFERDTGERHPQHETAAGNLAVLEAHMRTNGIKPTGSGTTTPTPNGGAARPPAAATAPRPIAMTAAPGSTRKATFLNWMFGRL
jgi:hypothetical protein